MSLSLKDRCLSFYERHEAKVDLGFFLGGFVVDVFTLAEIDDLLSITQQVIYLFVAGLILYLEFLVPRNLAKIHPRAEKLWRYRELLFHFILGSLLSIYSLFFLKSASLFSSMVFVVAMMTIMVANELKVVQKSQVNIKIALYMICLFSFFSMMFPVILGFIGWTPFLLASMTMILCLWGIYQLLMRKIQERSVLRRELVVPGSAIVLLFTLSYLLGWIPPVPLSVQNMGIYHKIEKRNDQFILSHENPWWRFWKNADEDFLAEDGDQIYFFARLFSPARFNDSVVLHWFFKDPRQGWQSTDRIPMQISGGSRRGYRGFSKKANYRTGHWRISVETTDGREIGRTYFEVKKAESSGELPVGRTFYQVVF